MVLLSLATAILVLLILHLGTQDYAWAGTKDTLVK